MEVLLDEAKLVESHGAELTQQAIEIQNPESNPVLAWNLDQLKNHFDSERTTLAEDMPDAIDIGPSLLSIVHSDVTLAYDAFTTRGTRDIYEDTFFASNKHQLTKTHAVRILSYMKINQPFIDNSPEKVNPPRFEFLMPILNYIEVKQNRRGRGMFLASDEVILLALRNSGTMVLTGKEVEPCHSRFMKFPPCKMPPKAENPNHIKLAKTEAQKSMEKFLEKCTYAGLNIYAKRTFPNTITERASTTLRKLDWSDMV